MKDDLDYIPAQEMSPFLPITLLAVCLLLTSIFQLSLMLPQRSQLQRVIAQNEQGVGQSQQVQQGLQRLVEGLVGIAKDDKDAQAIIAKHNIRVNNQAPNQAPAASPAR
ncbi:MAG: hypothetical protein ACFUZC_06640 [Chthoniobacteraceae bacterium]